jgi:hypothetical protein
MVRSRIFHVVEFYDYLRVLAFWKYVFIVEFITRNKN